MSTTASTYASRTETPHTRKAPRIYAFAAISALLFLCIASCALSACSESPTTATSSNAAATQQITDAYGRTVAVPATVNSVATVGSAARFVVYAGGAEGIAKLVAVTEKETSPAPNRPYTMVYADAFGALPSTSNGNHLMETSIDTEALLGIHPDVIVSSRSAAECDTLQQNTGIPVVGISYQDQLFTEDVYASILAVGTAIGTADHAQNTVGALKRWSADLEKRGNAGRAALEKAGRAEPHIYIGAVNYKGATSFGGTFQHYAPAEAVGATNVADALGGTGSVMASLEQLGTWNPDYLFLNTDNIGLLRSDYAAHAEFFGQLTAFQSGNLYSQPSFNFNGTNVELGVCDAYFIGSTIYPEAFGDVQLTKQYDEIFQTLLGSTYYEQMKAQGMDFTRVTL